MMTFTLTPFPILYFTTKRKISSKLITSMSWGTYILWIHTYDYVYIFFFLGNVYNILSSLFNSSYIFCYICSKFDLSMIFITWINTAGHSWIVHQYYQSSYVEEYAAIRKFIIRVFIYIVVNWVIKTLRLFIFYGENSIY